MWSVTLCLGHDRHKITNLFQRTGTKINVKEGTCIFSHQHVMQKMSTETLLTNNSFRPQMEKYATVHVKPISN